VVCLHGGTHPISHHCEAQLPPTYLTDPLSPIAADRRSACTTKLHGYCLHFHPKRYILDNVHRYEGDGSFLAGPTERTKVLLDIVQKLCKEESEKVRGSSTDHHTADISISIILCKHELSMPKVGQHKRNRNTQHGKAWERLVYYLVT